jgi:two-component system NarL family response regulator
MRLRILLADDHQMFLESLRLMLDREEDIKVVGMASNGLEVFKLAKELEPDIVCMDIGMPGMNGIEATRRLRTTCPQIKIIALSALSERRYVVEIMDAGASGYVTKAEACGELLRAIRAIQRGRRFVCADAAATLTDAQMDAGNGLETSSFPRLGPRERQVLQLIAEGHTSTQIAESLHIASGTVDVHRRNLMRKLNLHGVADLTRYAIRVGAAVG